MALGLIFVLSFFFVVCPGSMAVESQSSLMGKLEGPEVLVDFKPTKYNEAPMLTELVRAGKLPPVEARVGEDPLVLKPLHEIGKYGGTWRRGFIGPNDIANATRAVFHDKLLSWDYTGTKVMPHIAKDWKVSEDGKITTLYLRKGMKWSDGHPFTADDFVFWYEDLYLHKELNPVRAPELIVNGQLVRIEKVDTSTIRFVSPAPYYLLPEILAGVSRLGGHARWGRNALGGFAPAHYLKPFHPKYAGQEAVDQQAKAEGFDSWVQWFLFKNNSFKNPELPMVTAWTTTKPITEPVWVMERNPYSIWMDDAGNQLPYIDQVVMTLGENLEVLNLRAITGAYDSMARHMDLMKLPVFLENTERGGYNVHLDTTQHGGDAFLCFNQTYEEDPEITKWLQNTDFRRALSLGINREQINGVFFLGLGVPGSLAPAETTLYSPGPDTEYRTLWSTYDPEKANHMLDALGLEKRDAEGYRLRTDGKGRLRLDMQTYVSFMNFSELGEMVKQHWKDIGLFLDVKDLERGLAAQRRIANQHQIHVDVTWGANDIFGHPITIFPGSTDSCFGPLYGQWFVTGGEKGKEPPPRMQKVMENYKKAFSVLPKERTELAKEIWRIVLDEVYGIGTVGMSPAIQGLRVVKTTLGNVAERQLNSAVFDNPALSHPEQWYFKQ